MTTMDSLEQTVARRVDHLYDLSCALHQARLQLAELFRERMGEQLADLGMERACIRAHFSDIPVIQDALNRFSADGLDQVEFLLAPNPGEPERSLARIASGGEMSRIMLALKSISAEIDGVPSMVFDEIDTGISGRMAQIVAEKMAMLAKERQVICVTHLSQIAAMADAQYLVEKSESNGRTHTTVKSLDERGRVNELTRIIGGADPDNESSIRHATALLHEAAKRKLFLRQGNII